MSPDGDPSPLRDHGAKARLSRFGPLFLNFALFLTGTDVPSYVAEGRA
jgi:hypothetical protein